MVETVEIVCHEMIQHLGRVAASSGPCRVDSIGDCGSESSGCALPAPMVQGSPDPASTPCQLKLPADKRKD